MSATAVRRYKGDASLAAGNFPKSRRTGLEQTQKCALPDFLCLRLRYGLRAHVNASSKKNGEIGQINAMMEHEQNVEPNRPRSILLRR